MNKELSKMIINKSRIKKKLPYKKIKNNFNNLVKKSKNRHFRENASEGSTSSKSFWNTVKPSISSKETFSNNNIISEAANDTTLIIKEGNLASVIAKDEIRDEKILVEIFINIIEKLSGSAPKIYRKHIRPKP